MKDWPWIVGTALALVYFAWWEAYAFRHPDRVNTLSRSISTLGAKFPLVIFFMGLFCGGLAVHFFWHWCPEIGVGVGLLGEGR